MHGDMMTKERMHTAERNDAALVAESLNGNREAFRHIVERYQTLICSLAYSATGNVTQSEDVAQETFLTAWTELRSLREPAKLRAWLSGIARYKIQRFLRQDGREPVHRAALLDETLDPAVDEALPSEQAISREEEAILWRSLENIPEIYREPLVLYYREHQSIECVAAELDLTEDAVKQRLSRGRKLLRDEVQAFVENTLRRSAPREQFSSAILAALPIAVGPAATSGLSVAAKSTAAAKSGLLAWLLLPLTPFLGIAAGVGAEWLIIRSTTSDRKAQLKQSALVGTIWAVYVGLAAVGESALHTLGRHFDWSSRMRFVAMVSFWWLFILVTVTWLSLFLRKTAADRQAREAAGEIPPPNTVSIPAGSLALVVTGSHLMFFWFLRLTWNFHDGLATAAFAGALMISAIWSYLRLRGRPAAKVKSTVGRHLSLMALAILAIINLRAGSWAAFEYGVSVSEARQLQPLWLIPVLSLILIASPALILVLTKPKPLSRQG